MLECDWPTTRGSPRRRPHGQPGGAAPAAGRAGDCRGRKDEWFPRSSPPASVRADPVKTRSPGCVAEELGSDTGRAPRRDPFDPQPMDVLRDTGAVRARPPPGLDGTAGDRALAGRRRDPYVPSSLDISPTTPHPAARARPRRRAMGNVGFGELASGLAARQPPGKPGVRVGAGRAGRPPGSPRPAIRGPVTYLSARDSLQGVLAAGLLGGGSRFLGVAETPELSWHAALPLWTVPTADGRRRWDALARRWCGAPGRPGSTCPGSATRCTRCRTRARRGCWRSARRRACAARTCACTRRSAGCPRRCSAGPCRSTAPASAARRWPTWTCRWSCCAASRCWPGRPGCSGSWPRSAAARWRWTCTWRSTGTRSRSPSPSSDGGLNG